MSKIDETMFSITMIQVMLERFVALGVITANDQRAMYLEAADVLTQRGARRYAETINYLKFIGNGTDADTDELE